MEDELFPASPGVIRKRRNNKAAIRKWRESKNIKTLCQPGCDEPWTALGPDLTMDDVAAFCVDLEESGQLVHGATEQQACERLAENLGIDLGWTP